MRDQQPAQTPPDRAELVRRLANLKASCAALRGHGADPAYLSLQIKWLEAALRAGHE